MTFPPSIEELISEDTIRERVTQMGVEIAAALPHEARMQGVVVVGILKGAVIFMADLVRELGRNGVMVQMDFLWLSSYGAATESSGTVTLLQDLTLDVAGRHVLLVDDIIDTGRTLAYAQEHIQARGPASLRTTVFMDKPARRVVDAPVAFVGVSIPDQFVIGYGTDYAEDLRELAYVGVLGGT